VSNQLHKERIRSLYSENKVSENYIKERFTSPIGRALHEAQVNFVRSIIIKYGLKSSLEIAAGPARLTVDIAKGNEGIKGTIIDGNHNMLLLGQKRLRERGVDGLWHIVEGDTFSLPFNKNFQLIYTFRFIRHFHSEDRIKIYQQIYQHLIKGGLLVFDAVNYDVSYPLRVKDGLDNYPVYDKLYRFKELGEELKANGFEIIDYRSIQKNYLSQGFIQIWIAPRSYSLAYWLIKMIEKLNIGEPLEWIILCRKI